MGRPNTYFPRRCRQLSNLIHTLSDKQIQQGKVEDEDLGKVEYLDLYSDPDHHHHVTDAVTELSHLLVIDAAYRDL